MVYYGTLKKSPVPVWEIMANSGVAQTTPNYPNIKKILFQQNRLETYIIHIFILI